MKMRAGNRKINSGFTLIELMISLVLGLLVLLGVGKVFVSLKVSFDEMEKVVGRQEMISTILSIVSYEVRNSGSNAVELLCSSNDSNDCPDSFIVRSQDGLREGYCSGSDKSDAVEYFVDEVGGVHSFYAAHHCEDAYGGAYLNTEPVVIFDENLSLRLYADGICEDGDCIRLEVIDENDESIFSSYMTMREGIVPDNT
ncbi:prepilin-type N-terminal cleavage/methylation domain-containing protein [Halomonas pacifica]|uniref:prepilin-type N-terminal cleavage/methylation domain-containing protein n=1 Tax=Bisbaumannia pacifica TaxID=77098 RepID=UPI002358D590|nr:prepilin-type N-terminal cleavage/methylation domain-containing protein [Halomonas pacifica]MDC8805321.1 prepilin-type N-terminal cleavage/methylation domain-containing protein [Halomonas pacifica]